MILIEATIKYKGYDPDSLTHGSNKRICVSCDQCGRVRWIRNSAYHPLCYSCSNKGENIWNYGKSTKIIKICQLCGKKFKNYLLSPRKFCSRKCSSKWQSENLSGENSSLYNKPRSLEIRIKQSCIKQGIDRKDWNGFKTRDHVKREHKCLKLNNKIIGFDGHHIMSGVIIYIPRDIHQNIQHNIKSGKNMNEINKLAFNFLTGVL